MSSNAPAGAASIPFPMLVLAAIVVGAGIFYVSQYDSTSGWLLAGLILLAIAFAYPTMAGEIGKLFGNSATTVSSPNAASNGSVTVGPTGPVSSGGASGGGGF